MSTLMKWLIWLLAWLAFSFLTLNFCIEPECCAEAPPPPPPPVEDNYSLASNLGSGDVLQGTLWPDQRAQLIAAYQADSLQELQIYGHYYTGEEAPEDFENMGLYRAEQIKNLLIPDIPADKITTLARRIDGPAPAADKAWWEAGTFNWRATTEVQPPSEIIQLDTTEIIILFPFDSEQKHADANIDAYLQKLAARLLQTNERVTITGHTDSIDDPNYNMALGQRRADFIKNILVGHGAPADRITTRSEGESNPTATNINAAGRRLNRRAVVKLTDQ